MPETQNTVQRVTDPDHNPRPGRVSRLGGALNVNVNVTYVHIGRKKNLSK